MIYLCTLGYLGILYYFINKNASSDELTIVLKQIQSKKISQGNLTV